MKNVDFSNILFSIFSPKVILYPVKNSINPITSSVKDIINAKSDSNLKSIRSKSFLNLDINKSTLIPGELINKFRKDSKIEKFSTLKDIKKEYNNKLNLKYIQKRKLLSKKDIKTKKKNKNNSTNNLFYNSNLMQDFIIIKPKSSKANNYYKIYRKRELKSAVEPYKKYLSEKNKIEYSKKMKEIENKYIIESKRQKQLKFENDIRTKFQGIDFSRQGKRESFVEKLLKSKVYAKKEEIKNLDDNELNEIDIKYILKMIDFEVNKKKHIFLDNGNKFIPTVKYNDFEERYGIFNWNLRENPNYSILINYISNK